MTHLRSSSPVRARWVALGLGLALLASACGSSENGTADRDRNAQGGPITFTKVADGVSRTKIGDVALVIPIALSDAVQSDGSSLVLAPSMAIDNEGFSSDYLVLRLNADGTFDESFGDKGIGGVKGEQPFEDSPRLTNDGRLIVPRFQGRTFLDDPVGIRIVDAETGVGDVRYGENGVVDIDTESMGKVTAFTADSAGRVHVLTTLTSPTGEVTHVISRIPAADESTNYGEAGSVTLQKIEITGIENGAARSCSQPTLWSFDNEVLRAVSMCSITRLIGVAEEQTSENWRVMAVHEVSGDGTVAPVEYVWIDPIDTPQATLNSIAIDDLDVDPENAGDYLATVRGGGVPRLVRITDNFSTFGEVVRTVFPITSMSEQRPTLAMLAGVAYISGTTPRFVGVSADADAVALNLEVGRSVGENGLLDVSSVVKIADYPLITHAVANPQYTNNDDVFANLPYEPFDSKAELGLGESKVTTRNKVARIARNGVALDPNGIVDSPLNKGFSMPGALVAPGLFPAADGGMYALASTAPQPGSGESGAKIHVQKYAADGSRSGDTLVIAMAGASPNINTVRVTAAFDGADAFFVPSWFEGKPSVTKLSLSKKAVDASFGNGGHAAIPEGTKGIGADPFTFALQANRNGTVDVTTIERGETTTDLAQAFKISTVRLGANGQGDPAVPAARFEVVSKPDCSCADPTTSIERFINVAVDPAGRILVSTNEFVILDSDEPGIGESTEVKGNVVRYTRTGDVDTSFGNGGVGGATIAQVGGHLSLAAAQMAVHPSGNIFMTLTGIEIGVSDVQSMSDFDLFVEGEFLYALMLDPNGNPLNFSAQPPAELVRQVIDTIDGTRSGFAGYPAVGEGGAVPTAVVTAPAGVGAAAVVPADVVQVNSGSTPAISIIGTPADRTIDIRWSVPRALATGKANYTVTASPGGQKCTTSTTSCVFKKLEPWTAYTFTISSVAAAAVGVADSAPSLPVKPVRVVKRASTTELMKLITPASTGKQTWKVGGACKLSTDKRKFLASKDAGVCTLSVTTAKSGKTPKTTRTITVVVRAVAS